jgi:Cu/Ag efflux pump CusA
MLRSVIGTSIRFRFIVLALAAGLIAVSISQLSGMHSDVLPETSPTIVRIQTEALGLSSPEVEALVTVPLEKNLLEGVMGVTDVTSQSIPGLSDIDLHFAAGTNLYQARELVQERLTGAFVLPNVSSPPVMLQPVSSTGNVMVVGLTSSRLSLVDLSVLARWTIVPQLLGVSGVADVSTFGQADRQLQVLVDPARLKAHHIGLDQIIETAGNSQLVSPLSFLEASTPGTGGFLEGPNQRITIRHVLPFGTPDNLAQVPVAGVPGKPEPLGKVAQVVQGHQPLIGEGLVHGRPGLVLVVQKLPSASVLSVTRGLDAALAGLRPSMPGVHVDTTLFRPASYLDSADRNLRLSLIIAGVLLALALLALFGSFRLAFISLTAMALSMIAATFLLYELGYTFNALVTLGLLLALAVVADDAAGASYSLLARLSQGSQPGRNGSRRPAPGLVTAASEEFRGPVCAATLAIALSAAPLVFAYGLTANFLRPMVLAFLLALAVSMVLALVLTPALAAALLAVRPPALRVPALVTHLDRRYASLLARMLRLPRLALPALLVAGLAGLAVLPFMHPQQPRFQDRNLVIRWSGAPGMSLTEIDRVSARATQELLGLHGVRDVAATLGRAVSSDQTVNANAAQIWVTLRPDADYDSTVARVRAIAIGTPGIRGQLNTYETDSMSGVLTGRPDEAVVRLYGPGYPELAGLAHQVETAMRRIPGVRDPRVQLPVDQPTVDVRVNLDQATRDGVKPGDIRREAATLVSGLTAGNFFEQQKVFDVVVIGTQAVRQSLSSVQNLLLDTVNGGHVRLGSLASVRVAAEPSDIKHQAMSRYVDVTAQVPGGSTGRVRAAIASQLHSIRFPLDYYATVTGPPGAASTSAIKLASYAIAALIGIFLIAQAAAGSWRLALLLMAALPLPVAAAAVAGAAIGQRNSVAAAAALLAVLGIAIRQAFRILGAIRRAHLPEGGDLATGLALGAFVPGAAPVLGGAVATAVVLVPFIVMGNVPGNELLHTAALIILIGLIVATLVNLLILPATVLRLAPTAGGDKAGDEEPAAPARVQPTASRMS